MLLKILSDVSHAIGRRINKKGLMAAAFLLYSASQVSAEDAETILAPSINFLLNCGNLQLFFKDQRDTLSSVGDHDFFNSLCPRLDSIFKQIPGNDVTKCFPTEGYRSAFQACFTKF